VVVQTKRTSVVLNALRVTMRCLDLVPESPEAEKLRRRALAFESEAQQWSTKGPSVYEREAMMKQVLVLHVEVVKLGRTQATSG
jgi:hypothetical protein